MVRNLSKHLFGKLSQYSLVMGLLFAWTQNAQAQVSIAGVTPVTENFNTMGTGTTLPSNWKVTGSFTLATTAVTALAGTTVSVASTATLVNGMGVSGTGVPVGATITVTSGTQFTLSAGATGSGIASGATLLFTNAVTPSWSNAQNQTVVGAQATAGNATGRAYNYRDSTTTTDRAVGFQGGASYASPMNLMVNYKNTNTATINGLTISYKAERYRINSTAASIDFYYSTDGSTWTAVPSGAIAAASFPTGTAKYTFNGTGTGSVAQTTVNKTATISGLSIPNNGNIYIRWNFTLSTSNSQGIAIDDISTTASFAACVAPSSQATSLTFPSSGTGQISGSFAAASGGADGYLVVRYPNAASPSNPADVTIYTAGTALGAGTVVYAGAATSFTATGLAISTSYDFYVYSYNATSCVGGPNYNTTSPLIGTKSTSGCPTFAATVQIDPSLTRTDGSIYNNLTDALNDISGCPVSQATVFQLNSAYVSSTETFPLVLGAVSGMSSTNTITIRPASGASNLSISGSKNGNGIININAGTYWRLDGRSGGSGTTQNLTVENTDNTLAGSTAITFINGAQNNIVRYCKLRSSNIGVASGSVYFNTSSTVGNSDNTISDCDVFNSSTGNLPNVGISSVGSPGFSNDNNTISNNNIYDFFNAAGNSYGIYISDNTANWTISGNSIYETAARTLNSGTDRNWAGIGISPTLASSVNGIVISGNFIGGSAASCGGSAMSLSDNGTGNIVLRGIFAQVGTTTATSIQGNTIKNISISSSSTSANQSLISAVTGSFDIGTVSGNILGSGTGTGSVSLSQTTSSASPRLSGIIAGAGTPGAIAISNNTIGSLAASTTGSATITMAGIYATGAASSYTISNNNIGSSSTANSIQNNTSGDTWGIYLASSTISNTISGNTIANMNSGTGRMLGIRTDGGINSITGNTIRNNASASTGLTGNIGIWQASTSAGQTISGNTIHSLSNSDASSAAVVQGIYYTGPTTGSNVIEKNFVHSFSMATSSTSAVMYGIRVLSGAFPVTLQNNMVRLGVDASGSGISTGYAIYGMYNSSTGTIAHYHNTIYIGGSSVSGTTSNSIGFFSSGATNTRAIQNNIFQNAREGGSTGKHYAAQIGGSGANPTGLTCNNNLYHAPGSNGFLMLYNGADRDDLAAMRTANGQDAASVSCDPKLKAPAGTSSTVDLHIQASPVVTQVEGNGAAIASVTEDFDGQTRSSLTPNDIGADAGNFTAFVNPTVGSNAPVCANETLNLSVTPNASMSSPSYSWTGNGTFTASASVQNPGVSTGLVAGSSDYTVTITDANGCVSISTATVLVNGLPSVGSSASANTICAGTSVTLNGSGAVSYSWDNGASNNVAFTPSSTTTFTVTGTDANGCQNTSTETITVSPAPSLGSISQPTVCSGTIASFNLSGLTPLATFTVDFTVNGVAQTPFTGLNSDATGEASFNSPVPLTTTNNGQVLAITGLTRTDATPSCSASFSSGNAVTLTVNPSPSLSGISQTGSSCDGATSTIQLSGLLNNSISTISYSIGGVAQTPVTGVSASGTSASFQIPADYASNGSQLAITSITRTDASPSCTLSNPGSTLNLYVYPLPTVQISANDFVCQGQTAPIEFYFSGTSPWSMNYKINGSPQAAVNPASSPLVQAYSNATLAQTYEVISLSDAHCSALAAGLDSFTIDVPVPCSVTWNGSVSGDWNDKDNWTPNNSAPSNKTSVMIPGGTSNIPLVNSASPAPVCASLSMSGSANASIASEFSLNVRGDVSGNYQQIIGGDGKLVLSGTGTQTIAGYTRIKNLEIANSSAGGVVVATGATLQIEAGGLATFLASAKLSNNGTFKLASSAAGTAKIGPIPATATISGELSQERFVNRIPGAAGAWYFMATPFGGKNFTDWSDDFKVTGLTSGFGSQGGSILPNTDPERTSIFKYVEATHNQQLDSVQKIGWTIPGAADNIQPGTGYRSFISYYSNGSQRFDNTGTLTRGDFTFPSLTRSELGACIPASFDCQEANWRGWNLLGNPYPCDIDWESAAGWTKPAQMSNGWYRWNAAGTGFGVYAGGSYAGAGPNPSNPAIIPSGQAFFVRLSQAGNYNASLVVKEAAKSTGTAGQFARVASNQVAGLRVKLSRSGQAEESYYSAVLQFRSEATDGLDQQYDFASLGSADGFSITIPLDNEQLSIAGFAPVTESKTIPLQVSLQGQSGLFQLHFSEMDLLSEAHEVYLKDNLLGSLVPVQSGMEYAFAVSGSDALISNRFDLVFQNSLTSANSLVNAKGIQVFPNPASNSGKIEIHIPGSKEQEASIRLQDATGRLMIQKQMLLNQGKAMLNLSDSKLSPGIYFLEVVSGGSQSLTRIVLK